MRQDICLCAMHGLVIFFSFIPIGFNCFMSIRFIKSVLKTKWKNKISISEWKGTGLFQSLYTNKYDNLVENIFPTWTTRLIFHISCFLFYKKINVSLNLYFILEHQFIIAKDQMHSNHFEREKSFNRFSTRCVFQTISLFLSLWLNETMKHFLIQIHNLYIHIEGEINMNKLADNLKYKTRSKS